MKGFLKNRARGSVPPPPPPAPTGQEDTPFQFVTEGEGRIWIAVSEAQRARAWALVYGVYLAKGYAPADRQHLWYGLHDALPETTTFLAERDGRAVAALTVVPDSPLALPADGSFPKEVAALRRPGRRLCELVNLAAVDAEFHRGFETLLNMFRLAYLTALRLNHATDLVIRVSPQHRPFFERLLLFGQAGPEHPGGGPGISAGVLLRLDLETANRKYQAKYGLGGLYSFFVDPETEPALVDWLMHTRQPMHADALRRLFVTNRQVLTGASEDHRRYLTTRYPGCDLTCPPAKKAGSQPPAK